MINRIKGTQDLLDLTLFNYFLATVKKHLETYHFKEIATPILEPTELFKRSLGTETDVVSKEMYLVHTEHTPTEEKGDICLRPEATASTMRAFLNNSIDTTPWKVFTWGSMFRHERPQKGRYREFHQVSIEIIGSQAIAQDAYFIAMLDRLFSEKLMLDSYGLLINFMGCHDDRQKFRQQLLAFVEKNSDKICANCTHRKDKNILRVLDCKTPSCQELYQNAPKITDALCESCSQEWKLLQSFLEQLSVSFSHMPSLVRGLDYYGKTVFEFVSISDLGAQNTFCGGGRYDSLAKMLGAKDDKPSIGAAIGIERMLLMLEQSKELPLPQPARLHAIVPLSAEQIPLCLQIADLLHANDLCAEILLENDSIKSKMRQANKLGARYALIVGSNEQAAGTVTLKDMVQGTESSLPQRDIVSALLS